MSKDKKVEIPEEEIEEKIPKKKQRKYEEEIKQLQDKIDEMTKDMLQISMEKDLWMNKYYEAYADLDNTRKVIAKEREDILKYKAMGFVEKMLPALDNFEMAFKTLSDDPKIKNYQIGFQMILRQLTTVLNEEGVKVIEPAIGDEFNHDTMAAMSTVPGEEDNKVADVYLKGYVLKDRLVRPAMVIVSKKESVESAPEEKAEE